MGTEISKISQRVVELIKYKTPRIGRFEELKTGTGISENSWRKLFGMKQELTIQMLEIIVAKFPEYSEWILTGEVTGKQKNLDDEIIVDDFVNQLNIRSASRNGIKLNLGDPIQKSLKQIKLEKKIIDTWLSAPLIDGNPNDDSLDLSSRDDGIIEYESDIESLENHQFYAGHFEGDDRLDYEVESDISIIERNIRNKIEDLTDALVQEIKRLKKSN